MNGTGSSPLNTRALLFVPISLLITLWGWQYAFYKLFSKFEISGDEGTMMLRAHAFLTDPASYASIGGMYGPFYYIHKYAIHALFHSPVSHDFTRFTTLVLWGLIATACATFVLRLSRSLLLAGIVQLQLILQLEALTNEPGHPQEIALLLISVALLCSSSVTRERVGLAGMAGLGAAIGALLLVKVNLGIYLLAPAALTLLWALPRSPTLRVLRLAAMGVALVLPALIMREHLHTAWARNYCLLSTSVIAACLVASTRSDRSGGLRWSQVGVVALAAAATIGATCAVIVALGGSLSAIADSVVLRAANLPGVFLLRAPVGRTAAGVAAASSLLAIGWAAAFAHLRGRPAATALMSLLKLAYGCFVLYVAFFDRTFLLVRTIPLPFLWLVLIPSPGSTEEETPNAFPRIFLGLLAAFQTLQAYPVYGSQAVWSVFLVIPAAAIAIADGSRHLLALLRRAVPVSISMRAMSRFSTMASVLALGGVFALYDAASGLAFVRAYYKSLTPLDLPGAHRLRVSYIHADWIHWTVDRVGTRCDGFVGMPGFASLYFWTRIPPPGLINNSWVLNLDDETQAAIVTRMRTCERPCVLVNSSHLPRWNVVRPTYVESPLFQYIQKEFEPADSHGPFTLMVKSNKPPRPYYPWAFP